MCECSPTSSRRGCSSAAATAFRAAPDSIEKPNLESSCPVEMWSCVSGFTPGDSRSITGARAPVMLRLSPGVKPDTHDHISTGQLDSKFGFSIESGAARKAVEAALQHPRLDLVGL